MSDLGPPTSASSLLPVFADRSNRERHSLALPADMQYLGTILKVSQPKHEPNSGDKARGIMSVAAVGLAVGLPGAAQASVTFSNLGVLPGGTTSAAYGVNANGGVVAGYCDTASGARAFRWTSGGLQNLGVISGGTDSYVAGVNADGSVIAGHCIISDGTTRAYRWTAAGGMKSLGVLSGSFGSEGRGISADGSVVVGTSFYSGAAGDRAFRWTAAGGMQNLGLVSGSFDSSGYSVSADGAVVGGQCHMIGSGNAHPVRWTAATGMQEVPLDVGWTSGAVVGLSSDGTYMVGSVAAFTSDSFRAARWTTSGGMQTLGVVPGGVSSVGYAISGDGSRVVGTSRIGDSNWRAFMWTESLGMVDLNTYLPTLGVDLTGWTLTYTRAVSFDGTACVGEGTYNGQTRGWAVTGIPSPAGLPALIGAVCVATWRRQRRTNRITH